MTELEKKYKEMVVELAGLKLKHSLGKVQNSASIRSLRRDIARTLTEIHVQRRENE